jgi:hypothetical protein
MTNKSTFALLLFSMLILGGACTPVYYLPNTLQVPTIREKGDLTLDLGIACDDVTPIINDDASGLDVKVAYSPLKHTIVMANYMRLDGQTTQGLNLDPAFPNGQTIVNRGYGYTVEAGGGGYYSFGKGGELLFDRWIWCRGFK